MATPARPARPTRPRQDVRSHQAAKGVAAALVAHKAAAVPWLLDALRHGCRARAAVIAALGQLGDRRASFPLFQILRQPDDVPVDVHPAVVKALGELREASAADYLVPLLESRDANLAGLTAVALRNIGTPAALAGLTRHAATRERREAERQAYEASLVPLKCIDCGEVERVEPSDERLQRGYECWACLDKFSNSP